MVALVLDDAGVKALGLALDRPAVAVEAACSGCARSAARRRAVPGTDRQPSQPSSSSLPSGVIVGLISTVSGTGGASG